MEREVTGRKPQYRPDDIAVIGVSCRFPGANSPEQFWKLLSEGKNAVVTVPEDRWNLEEFMHSDPDAPGKMYSKWGGFLQQDISGFDAKFFGISPHEANSMDPQQRIFLEVAWEALEDAGIKPSELSGTKAGVFVGMWANDYLALQSQNPAIINAYSNTATSASVISGRLSFLLNLKGPSLTADTASSASLVAVHLACQSLRSGEASMAIAGGVNLILTPEATIGFCKSRAMAIDGQCRAFDASGNGYVRAEGCGIVILKKLAEALDHGDNIIGVIRASSVNQDGRTPSLMAPSEDSQAALTADNLEKAGVSPEKITYFEAHGTGTKVGDPIEFRSLARTLAKNRTTENPLYIGSVKTNIGHLESAAGIAGLVKVLMCLKHKKIPAHLHLKKVNPEINLESIPAVIPTALMDWNPKNGTRIAGVNSFGLSGTNAQVIVEEPPSKGQVEQKGNLAERPFHTLFLSAKDEPALLALVKNYIEKLDMNEWSSLGDLCASANRYRTHHSVRLGVVANSFSMLRKRLESFVSGTHSPGVFHSSALNKVTDQKVDGTRKRNSRPNLDGSSLITLDSLLAGKEDSPKKGKAKIAFLFSGQGSQYSFMAKELYETQPKFREAIDDCAKILSQYLEKPIVKVMFDPAEEKTLLTEIKYTQPILCSIEYAVAQMWMSWGIQPNALMGHSMGEYIAACIAGVMSLEDALKLVVKRIEWVEKLAKPGEMGAVNTGEVKVREALKGYEDKVSIAALNGPQNTVISGEREAVKTILANLERQGIKVKLLAIGWASHSPLIDPVLEEFERVGQSVKYSNPKIDLISNLTGTKVTDGEVNGTYWRNHLRNTVKFANGIKYMLGQGYNRFIEVSPGTTVLGMGQQSMEDGLQVGWYPTMKKDRTDWEQVLESVAGLFASGVDLDWQAIDAGFPQRTRTSLPTYPFQHKSYWISGLRPGQRRSFTRGGKAKTLTGRHIQSPILASSSIYEIAVSLEFSPILKDIAIRGMNAYPFALQVLRVFMCASSKYGSDSITLNDVQFVEPIAISPEMSLSQLTFQNGDSVGLFSFGMYNKRDGKSDEWELHMSGTGRHSAATKWPSREFLAPKDMRKSCPEGLLPEEWKEQFNKAGFKYGENFDWIDKMWIGDDCALASLFNSRIEEYTEAGDNVHPGLIESMLQIPLFFELRNSQNKAPMEAKFVKTINLKKSSSKKFWCYAFKKGDEEGMAQYDVLLLDEETNEVLVEVIGLRVGLVKSVKFLNPAWSSVSEEKQAEKTNSLLTSLAPEKDEKRLEILVKALRDEVCVLLGLELDADIDPTKSLKQQGVDSLAGVELRNRIRNQLDQRVTLSPTLILDYPTLEGIALHLLKTLKSAGLLGEDSGTQRVEPKNADPTVQSEDVALDSLLEDAAALLGDDVIAAEMAEITQTKKAA